MTTSKQTLELDALRVVMMLVQHINSDPAWLTPPEDGDHLRTALLYLASELRRSPIPEHKQRAAQISKAIWLPIQYLNSYSCVACGAGWTDTHTCACDDDCPKCGATMSPESSVRTDTPTLPGQVGKWQEIGEGPGGKQTRLLAHVTMLGTDFHAEAVQVRTTKRGTQTALCEEGEQRLDAIHEEFGTSGPFETVDLAGRDYVLIITPYQN